MRLSIYITAILICIATQLFSQNNQLNEDAWRNTTSRTEYFEEGYEGNATESSDSESTSYDDLKKGDKEKKQEDQSSSNKQSRRSSSSSIPSWLSTFLMIIVIGLLLFFIVSTILNNPSAAKKKNINSVSSFTEAELEEIERNPFENDLEKFIHQAKQSGNTKLAIRFSFIYCIRLLAENNLIIWKKDKTNHQYFNELTGSEFQDTFLQMKLIYETSWYGNSPLQEQLLDNALTMFDIQISKLKNYSESS